MRYFILFVFLVSFIACADAQDSAAPSDISSAAQAARGVDYHELARRNVAAGNRFSCAVAASGKVYCWGDKDYIGDGSSTSGTTNEAVEVSGIQGATQVVAGAYHACALIHDGTVKCWGENLYGQLGDGEFLDEDYYEQTPVSVCATGSKSSSCTALTNVLQISAGTQFTCALVRNGSDSEVRCWGQNGAGQLGKDAITTYEDNPVAVRWDGGGVLVGAQAVAAGSDHACALLDGWVACWGEGSSGQLGGGDFSDHDGANGGVLLSGGGYLLDVIDVTAGSYFSCAVTAAGTGYCWGSDAAGQLGNGATTGSKSRAETVSGTSGFVQITAGFNTACGVTVSGYAYCWGSDSQGKLGNDSPEAAVDAPSALGSTNDKYAAIDLGSDHACGIEHDGEVRCWGDNAWKQVGTTSTATNYLYPSDRIEDSTAGTGDYIRATVGLSLSSGAVHSCVRNNKGEVRCWGEDDYGQLGNGGSGAQTTPQVIASGAVDVAAGERHACMVSRYGGVSCWGQNDQGQVGPLSGEDPASDPQQTPFPVNISSVRQVVVGARHSCALTGADEVKCWGSDSDGQLGNGAGGSGSSPGSVSGLSTSGANAVKQIAAGDHFTCALLVGGGIKCWGDDSYGQLGDGTYGTDSQTPVTVDTSGSGYDFIAIAAGNRHVCALNLGGEIWCWGDDNHGQLGGSPYSFDDTPSEVSGSYNDFVDVYAGGDRSCGIRVSGSAYCWGENATGAVGDNVVSPSDRSTPTAVASAINSNGIKTLSLGETFSCAAYKNGTAACWGSNWNSQGTTDKDGASITLE